MNQVGTCGFWHGCLVDVWYVLRVDRRPRSNIELPEGSFGHVLQTIVGQRQRMHLAARQTLGLHGGRL